MKLCIPTSYAGGPDAPVGDHFGRATWFHVVDTSTGTFESVRNPACHAHPGYCHHVDMLGTLGVTAVAGVRIGRNAAEGLRAAGIEVLEAEGRTVAEVACAVGAGACRPLPVDTGCRGHGHGDQNRHGHGHANEHTCHDDQVQGHRPHGDRHPRSRRRQREG